MDEQSIFAAALERDDPRQRAAWLDEACGDDSELRRRVERLLDVHAAAGSFLESPAAGAATAKTVDMPPIAEAPGTQIGPYKLLEQIGEGGFGVVFMAAQEQPVRRRVALKVIKPGMDTREVIARFEAERQALALMDHPNIARVLDAGSTESGRPYFVMELVKGVPITDYCDRYHLTPRARLELFATVCQAVQHAHHKGVIHRDIKPSNVLVTLYDGRPVAKVIDFGVAKAINQRLTERTLFTQFAQMVGTPLYMSPEQAELSGLDVDTRSDVYSLGVLLYELLTGTTPLEKQRLHEAAFDEIRRLIREEEPPKPSLRISELSRSGVPSRNRASNGVASQNAPARQAGATSLASIAAHRHTEPKKLGPLLRGELDWIVMKALEKDRTRRYDSANGFAADVLRYLSDEPVLACSPSAGYRFRKFARRNNRVLMTAAVLAIAALATAATLTLSAVDYGRKQRDLAEQKETLRQETASDLYAALLRHSAALRTAREPGYRSQVWKNLHEAAALEAPVKDLDEIRREVLACLGDPIGLDAIESPTVKRSVPAAVPQVFQTLLEELQTAAGGQPVISAVTRDGELLATAGPLTLWGKDRTRLATADVPLGQVHALEFTPDGGLLIGGCEEGTVVWTVPGLVRHTFLRGDVVRSLAVDNWGELLATGGNARRIELWSLSSSRLVAVLPAASHASTVEFDAEGEFLLALSAGTPLAAWSIKRTPEKHLLAGHRAGVPGVAFSPDGRRLASVSKDRTVKIWDAESGGLIHTCLGHNAQVQALAYSPDGKLLATGDWKGEVRLWDPESGDALTSGKALGQIWGLRFDASGRWLAGAGDGGLVAWTAQRSAGAVALEPFLKISLDTAVIDLAVHPGGSQLVFICWDDRQIYAYDLARAMGPRPLNIQSGLHLDSLHFDPAGNQLRYVTPAGALGAWDWHQAAAGTTAGAGFKFPAQSQSPDARWAAGEGLPGQVVICDLHNDRELFVLPAEANRPWCLDWSPDGTRLAVGLSDGGLAIWDLDQVRARLAEFGIAVPSTAVQRSSLPKVRSLSESEFQQIVTAHKQPAEAFADASILSAAGRHEEAIQTSRNRLGMGPHPTRYNNLAWLLVTCPDLRLRDGGEALQLARTAVELAPDQTAHWNTLGVAHYRVGEWSKALSALKKSEDLAPGKHFSFNGFFLAMACWQLDDKEQAGEWYRSSVAWLGKNQPLLQQNSAWAEELRRFRAEAEELMGIDREADEITSHRSEVSTPVEAPRPQQNQRASAAPTDHGPPE